MLVENYFQQIEQKISISPYIVEMRLNLDKRSLYVGFIEGFIKFLNGSILHLIEFIDTKIHINRYKYSFHYQDKNQKMIFRYDMAPHHKNIETFPHHKHVESEEKVIKSMPPVLSDVLNEIIIQWL